MELFVKCKEKKNKSLMIGDEVMGVYKIASLPYGTKSEAYDVIREDWQGVPDVTTFFNDGFWYIIAK